MERMLALVVVFGYDISRLKALIDIDMLSIRKGFKMFNRDGESATILFIVFSAVFKLNKVKNLSPSICSHNQQSISCMHTFEGIICGNQI